jgi:KipI family sensor histidine kinase inhibitor
MTLDATLLPVGDRALLVELGSMAAVHLALRNWLDQPLLGVEEMVAGAETVLLIGRADPVEVMERLATITHDHHPPTGRSHIIPTVYDGPDLGDLAAQTGLTVGELVKAHSDAEYRVAFMGFSPGFAYLSGGDRRLHVPRRPTPRTSVPAGSVAVAAGLSAVYPQATPGGWALIGRADAVMFDPYRPEPALLAPGDRVRFQIIDEVALSPSSSLSSSLSSVVPEPSAGAPAIEIVEPGPLLTVQDGGRPGWRHVGVPVGGAADRRSATRANLLVGNPPDGALFESTIGSCRFRLRAERRVAVTGAAAEITVDGLPARGGVALDLRAGTEVRIGPCRAGVRVYVAISGGVDVPAVLGSRSTDTLSGLGPAPLRAGQAVPVGSCVPPGIIPSADIPGPTSISTPRDTLVVKARLGPRDDWLSTEGRRVLEGAPGGLGGGLRVAASSDRTGVRLEGPIVERSRSRPGEIPSEGMVAGAIQVPPSGQPIVLMRNHPPTGGYPVVAVVADEGIDALAQAPPGTMVRFEFGRG